MKKLTIKAKLLVSLIFSSALFTILLSVFSGLFYYSNYSDLVNSQILTTSKQIVFNIEDYFRNVSVLVDCVQSKLLNIDIVNQKEVTSAYFIDIKSIRDELNSISLYDNDGNFIVGSDEMTYPSNASNEERFKLAKEEELISIYSRPEIEDNTYHFTVSKFVTYNTEKSNGIIKFDLNFSKILDIFTGSNLGAKGHLVILDRDFYPVYSTHPDYIEEDITSVSTVVLGNGYATIDDSPFNLYISTIFNTGWSVGIFSDNSQFNALFNDYLTFITITTIFFIIVFIIAIVIVANGITRPIRVLQYEIRNIVDLDYDPKQIRIVKGNREVEDLSKNFISMLNRIKELTDKVVREQETQRKTELLALQNQINPHFLYNTLDSILAMIEQNENEKSEQMIIALSKFFRISISKGKNIIPLKDEIEHAKNYLLIQKIRFRDDFTYSFEVDESLFDFKVNKLILQPLIENAIEHGMNEGSQIGFILIKCYKEGEFLFLEVTDNGYGMSDEKIKYIYDCFKDKTKAKSVGLINVFQRIRVYYGESADIKIFSSDEGTTVRIILPLKGVIKNETI